jgi:adenylate kinase family enzyme
MSSKLSTNKRITANRLRKLSSRKLSKKNFNTLRDLVYNDDYKLLESVGWRTKTSDKDEPLKLLVIGNSGCGKTYLSGKLGEKLNIPVIHMDKFFFRTGGYTAEYRVSEAERNLMIKITLQLKSFIIEGADGPLAEVFASHCNELIFIDYPWKVCHNSILNRKLDPGMKSDDEATKWLINWAKTYYNNPITMDNSHKRHIKLFDDFKGSKHYISSRTIANRIFSITH